ncbi:MAG: amidohydrolase [Actinobacteria bacterium]|nr:amidohydrolase [Actinomycetota bacterium]
MAVGYQLVSADSHLEIDVDRWVGYVPAEHRERAPRRIRLANGGDAWLIEGRPLHIVGMELCGGRSFEEFEPAGSRYDEVAGAGSPEQRVAEQDRDGVDAEVLFPGICGPNFWRGIGNDEAYRAVVHAYNRFLVEEYTAVAPDRLLALGVIPETGIDDALAELRYCAEHGLKGVCLNGWPAGRTYPDEQDDPFWREALALDMPISVHVALRFMGGATTGRTLDYPQQPPTDMSHVGLDPLRRMAVWNQGGGLNAAQLLFAGTFERLPDLQIYFAENNLGWIPMFFEQLDMLYLRNIHWAKRYFGMRTLDRSPSDYLKEHVHWGFLNNPFGVKVRHDIGVDNVMWANDFPHSDSDWPRSGEVLASMMEGVPEDEVRRMTCDNAVRFFRLDHGR